MWRIGCSFTLAATALLASVDASTLTPPVLPLIVRNPYLSTWLSNARDFPWNKWPTFWRGHELGFSILVSVPDSATAYPLLGRPHDSLNPDGDDGYNISFPVYKGAKYDASTTNLTYAIPAPQSDTEPLEITVSFLSPITPSSTLRQSIPAAYVSVYVAGGFNIDLYIDVNGQWVSGDRESKIIWGLSENLEGGPNGLLKTWTVKKATEELFTELDDHAEWGELHFTAPADARHECGASAALRQRFSRTGTLQNELDGNFRRIMENEPVFAFSTSFKLGPNIDSSSSNSSYPTSASATFTIAHVQNPVTQYASPRGLTLMRPLWLSWFETTEKLLAYHYFDFSNAYALAQNYSEQLAIDAYQSGSSSYVDIVALSARQVMGGTSFSGTAEDPILFLKEISSDGNCQTVDVIFPAFPFFLYSNPRWGAYLLKPLIEHQLSGQYPNKYSMHDLGSSFPNVTGHADGKDEYMPVEECGDMLIMGLALVNSMLYDSNREAQSIWSSIGDQAVDHPSSAPQFPLSLGMQGEISNLDDRWGGNIKGTNEAKEWIRHSYTLWKQWSGYLVEFSLEPHNQLSTDDFAGWLALQSNLALKGIIGIKAMSQLATLVGNSNDAKYYGNISDTYIKKWEEFAISRDKTHAKLAYDWYGSWTTLYSLYADALLCFHTGSSGSATDLETHPMHDDPNQNPFQSSTTTKRPSNKNFIPTHIYSMQSKWYAAVIQKYGLPLDSRHLYTKSDWEFEAAAVTSKKVRADILARVAKWLNETSTDLPFTDLYDTEGDGGFPGHYFHARPVVGGHFAFLALERACGGQAMKAFENLD